MSSSSHKPTIVIIGPAYPLRGGLASFNERLARAFKQQQLPTHIYTFSLQYPNFLFPGTTQFSTDPPPKDLFIKVNINSINPFNWIKIGRKLKKVKPSIIVVRYWLPFMGPCLGTILRIAKKNKYTKVICIADNIIPHEKRFGDNLFTKYFVKPVDGFVTMSDKVLEDVKIFSQKKAINVTHPLYDNFGDAVTKLEAQKYLQINTTKKTLLFFGFIRKYKGLDILLDAIKIIKDTNKIFYDNVQLIIAGEYYEDATLYTDKIKELQLEEIIIDKTNFIADSEVKYYLCAADVVIQPYRNATQSGVTPLAYHFNTPMIVTNVGALAANVPHQKVGLVCEPNAMDIAKSIIEFYHYDYNLFLENLKEEKKKYSWEILTDTILNLAK
jgi:glycosyltransferase involved in cell wall biosynthesis